MSTGDPPKITPQASQPDPDDDSSVLEQPVPGDGSDGSNAAPADGSNAAPADGSNAAPADGSNAAPADGAADQSGDGSSDQAGTSSTAGGTSSDPATDNSDDCAQIPCAAHVVLEADIKLVLRFPAADPSQGSHKLTLSNDDGSYTKTLTFPTDCQPGDTEGTLVMTFDGLTDGHTYSLQDVDGDETYSVFDPVDYHEIADKLRASGGAPPGASPAASDPATTDPGDQTSPGST